MVSEWIDWKVDEAPPCGNIRIKIRNGCEIKGDAKEFRWVFWNDASDIVQYRYEEDNDTSEFWVNNEDYTMPTTGYVYVETMDGTRTFGYADQFNWNKESGVKLIKRYKVIFHHRVYQIVSW